MLARPHPLEDAGVFEDLKVPGNSGRGNGKRFGQLRHGAIRPGGAEEDFPPRRVGECAENPIKLKRTTFNHIVKR
jgi:hypothetical protein